jgi:hypothetical protein
MTLATLRRNDPRVRLREAPLCAITARQGIHGPLLISESCYELSLSTHPTTIDIVSYQR